MTWTLQPRRLGIAGALLLALAPLGGCATSTHLRQSEYAQVAGRTYVVVGASSGIGQGVALRLGQLRANVVLAARRTDLLEQVASQIRASGGQALVVTTDVSQAPQVDALAAAAKQRFGRVDVWMNIAGVGANGRFWDIPAADHSRLIDVNLKGVVYGSQAALRGFIAQGHGTLVNMGSVESVIPIAYHASYGATKAGVLHLGRTLNEEIRHAGFARTIKVATVMPYAVDTPFFQHMANYSGRADRMILLDKPDKIVRALVWVSLHPKEELPVGWKAQMATSSYDLLPDLTERISADVHRSELAKGTPVAPTSGSIHQPMPEGRTPEGGVSARMKAENAARAKQPKN